METTTTGLILALAAAFLVGFAKTGVPGIGILIVPTLVAVFPAKMALGTLLPMLILGDIFAVVRYRRHAQWSKLWRLLPFVLLGMIPGRFFLANVADERLKLALGILVLFLILLELARRRYNWQRMPKSLVFAGTMGILAGFATTIGSMAGPIMGIYLLSMGLDKHKFMGTGAWYYITMNVVKIPLYGQLGMIKAETLRFDLMGAPLVITGALLGIAVLPRIPQKLFTRLIFVLAAVAAFVLIYSALGSNGG